MRRVYLDSCIVIYLHEAPKEVQRKIWDQMRPTGGETTFCFSDLTRLECRVWPLGRHNQVLLAEYDRFFRLQELSRLPLDPWTFDLATELRAAHRLKTPDALHLATALIAGCEEFWTNDNPLSRVPAEIRFQVFP